MNLEDIKSYKDACKIINRKPRRYRDNHINAYEQLSTITAKEVRTIENLNNKLKTLSNDIRTISKS